jgi:hypothetical protein
MVPTSDAVEAFLTRLRKLDAALAKLTPGAKVVRAQHVESIALAAKDWLRVSSVLSGVDGVDAKALSAYDASMQAAFNSTTNRVRAAMYRRYLSPLLEGLLDNVVVPLLRHEVSPTQLAASALTRTFEGALSEDEAAYIEEAARCVTVRCHRAAVIMLWAAGVSRIHQAVLAAGFDNFNRAAAATTSKRTSPFNRVKTHGDVRSLAELQGVRDFDLLVIGMELWGFDMPVYEELSRLLGQRNGSAHPGSFIPDVYTVQMFAQNLRSYLFDKIRA